MQRIHFRANTQRVPPHISSATHKATAISLAQRAAAIQSLGAEHWETLRQAAHDLRLHGILHLDHYLPRVEENVTQAGGSVHWASDAADARRIVLEIAARRHARRIVKVKSAATEEIDLNRALQNAGLQVLETDLGEYIVQLAGDKPSHPTAPAVHLTKEEIAALFRDKLGIDAPPDARALCEIARAKLREEFLAADLGISGGNFIVAETGTLVIVTNEGNGRMCTALPPMHVAVVGIDKVIPDWESLSVLLKLLARSVSGQKMSSYVTFITGVHAGGPREFHLVLLDNGRTRILQDEKARETLLCIRCGACANICPVYHHVGGHAYGWTYFGPIGAILAPQLLGAEIAGDLPFASSLCGACADVCPVKIPIPSILLHLRRRVVEGTAASPIARAGAFALGESRLYVWGARILRVLQSPLRRGAWLPTLPPPLNRWTMTRSFPAFRADFRAWWKKGPANRAKND
jgi:L-lactate dehydrogenase complex protein LldF